MPTIMPALQNAAQQAQKAAKSEAAGPSSDFGDMLKNAITDTFQAQQKSEHMSIAAANGADIPMHQVIESINRAELTLQTMISVRDKAVEAYQEVIRMPI